MRLQGTVRLSGVRGGAKRGIGCALALAVVAGAVFALPAEAAQPAGRTRAQVEAAINQAGTTPPEWWNSVQLNYPKTIDLTWKVTPGPWNPQKNLGAYLWSVINENPSKWHEGVKLLHYVLTVNKDDPAKYRMTCEALGRSYDRLLTDYARAAYWWRKAGAGHELDLAHCYWKLGSEEMATEILAAYGNDDTRDGDVIKLWSDMGDLPRALEVAEDKAANDWPDPAWLAAGHACRLAGKYPEAIAYYQKVATVRKSGGDLKRNKERALASIAAVKVFDMADPKRVPDGVYRSQSIGYAGPMHVEVHVRAGRIEAVKVVAHQEKQFYSALTDTPAQIVRKQSVKGIDAVTGATITSEAIINATAKALAAAAP